MNTVNVRFIALGELMQRYGRSCLAGKPINVQYKFPASNSWFDATTNPPTFDVTLDWREKPKEPRRIYVCFNALHDACKVFTADDGKCSKFLSTAEGVECVEFIEVLKEENK